MGCSASTLSVQRLATTVPAACSTAATHTWVAEVSTATMDEPTSTPELVSLRPRPPPAATPQPPLPRVRSAGDVRSADDLFDVDLKSIPRRSRRSRRERWSAGDVPSLGAASGFPTAEALGRRPAGSGASTCAFAAARAPLLHVTPHEAIAVAPATFQRMAAGATTVDRSAAAAGGDGGGGGDATVGGDRKVLATPFGAPFALMLDEGEAAAAAARPFELLARREVPRKYRSGSLRYLRGYHKPVVAVAVSKDGMRASLAMGRGRTLSVCSSFSTTSLVEPAVSRLKLRNFDRAIRQIDVRTGEWVATMHEGPDVLSTNDLEYLWEGDSLVAGTVEGHSRVFGCTLSRIKKELGEDGWDVMQVCVSSDAQHVATVASTLIGAGGVTVFSLESGHQVGTFRRSSVRMTAFHPFNPHMAVLCRIRTYIWGYRDGALLQSLPTDNFTRSLAFGGNGCLFTVESLTVSCWENAADECVVGTTEAESCVDYELKWVKDNGCPRAISADTNSLTPSSHSSVAKASLGEADDSDCTTTAGDTGTLPGTPEMAGDADPFAAPRKESLARNRRVISLPGQALMLVGSTPEVTILDCATGSELDAFFLKGNPLAASAGQNVALVSDTLGNVYAFDIVTV